MLSRFAQNIGEGLRKASLPPAAMTEIVKKGALDALADGLC
jgi:hypothetical protein